MGVKEAQTVKYAINGLENGLNITNNKVMSKRAIVDNFIRMCNSDDIKRVIYEEDKKDGMSKSGITTYGVETKDAYLNTITIHQNCYNECKDEMAMLYGAVQRAQEKLDNKKKANDKQEKIRKTVRNGLIVFSTAMVVLAGKIELDKHFNANTDQVITRTAETDHGSTDATQEIDNTEDLDTITTMTPEEIINSYENSLKQETQNELEELKQRREELGLNPDSLTPVEQPTETEENKSDDEFHPSYGYNDIYNDAEKTKQVIDEFNEYENQRQKEELEELRESYKQEYKTR